MIVTRQPVGSVERSDTHHARTCIKVMGFAGAQPILRANMHAAHASCPTRRGSLPIIVLSGGLHGVH